MPASEIDDIFASSKGKARAPHPPQPSTSTALPPKKKKSKVLKRRRDVDDEDELDSQPKTLTKSRVPETIVDPSEGLTASNSNHPQPPKVSQSTKAPPKKRKVEREAEQRFKDSRGSGSRRKTEEGFAIYKEDELGITAVGGDTPLCPFDCQCCF